MVAMLAFGGTYAYFTATAKNGSTGNFETGKVLLTKTSTISTVSKKVVPKDDIEPSGKGDFEELEQYEKFRDIIVSNKNNNHSLIYRD